MKPVRKVVIAGATGPTGIQLAGRLVARGLQVTGIHRRIAQAEVLRAIGAEPVHAQLGEDTVQRFEEIVQGADAIVYTAGSAVGAPNAEAERVDGLGVSRLAEAALATGVRRFILVSVFPDAGRGQNPDAAFEHYMRVKREAETALAALPLNWVIVRPGTLTDAPGGGQVQAGLAIPYAGISREDLAETLAEIVLVPELHRLIIELTAGQQTVQEALQDMTAFSGKSVFCVH